ncbi:MAG: ParB N-terminal domain-containing protein [Candidatus Micrarchaeia archaeon]
MPLITEEEEKRLFEKLKAYYERLYGIPFRAEKTILTPAEIGELHYTYPGEEVEATFEEKVADIEAALSAGYNVPVIILRKEKQGKNIILDGHRRLRVAWRRRIPWPAFLLIPLKEIDFAIEKTITGKIGELWKS